MVIQVLDVVHFLLLLFVPISFFPCLSCSIVFAVNVTEEESYPFLHLLLSLCMVLSTKSHVVT